MQLKELKIERKRWGKNKGQYEGTAEFDNELGLVAIKLSAEKCDELFIVCADGIVSTAKEAAKELSCAILEHQKKLTKDV